MDEMQDDAINSRRKFLRMFGVSSAGVALASAAATSKAKIRRAAKTPRPRSKSCKSPTKSSTSAPSSSSSWYWCSAVWISFWRCSLQAAPQYIQARVSHPVPGHQPHGASGRVGRREVLVRTIKRVSPMLVAPHCRSSKSKTIAVIGFEMVRS
ncbi:MAG: hypothetical protein CM15mP103_08740 [Gammaproteobacteria bacterium]|nr:MAG: hypothetical protein CM15mP103_08740 [Gammaproteobacteria bacterium]